MVEIIKEEKNEIHTHSEQHEHGGYVHTHGGEQHTHGNITHTHETHSEDKHTHEPHCDGAHSEKSVNIAHDGYTHTHDGYTHSHDGHTHPTELDRNHKHANISDIHSCKENELDGAMPKTAVCDDEHTMACREEYQKDNTNKDKIIALGVALQKQLRYREAREYYDMAVELYPDDYTAHRKKAFCHMAMLNTAIAKQEFLWCEQRTDDLLDIKYRLACIAYYEGEYLSAKRLFDECYPLCVCRDEMYIAVLYWELLCDVRLKIDVGETLKKYHADIKAGHHTGYLATVKLFLSGDERGLMDLIGEDELNEAIYLFGKGCYLESIGDRQGSNETYHHALLHDLYFSSFAYLGLYSDKRRGIIE